MPKHNTNNLEMRTSEASSNIELAKMFIDGFQRNTRRQKDRQNVFGVTLEELLRRKARIFILVTPEGEVVAGLYVYDKGIVDHFCGLFCAPGYRRLGLSTRLISLARIELSTKRIRPASCEIRMFEEDGKLNLGGLSAFQKCGFYADGMACRHRISGTDRDFHLLKTARNDATFMTQPLIARPESLELLKMQNP